MGVFLVTFEIEQPVTRFLVGTEIYKHDYAQLSATAFVIRTSKGEEQLFAQLQDLIDETDSLYVLTLAPSFLALGETNVVNWLGSRMAVAALPDAARASG